MNQDWCTSEQVCEELKCTVLRIPNKGTPCYKYRKNTPKPVLIRLGPLKKNCKLIFVCITQL